MDFKFAWLKPLNAAAQNTSKTLPDYILQKKYRRSLRPPFWFGCFSMSRGGPHPQTAVFIPNLAYIRAVSNAARVVELLGASLAHHDDPLTT
jgi:hypothetical protein